MNLFTKSAILILIFLTQANVYAQDTGKPFNDLNLLLGKWSMETNKGILYESWKKQNDSTFTGLSFRISGKDSLVLEGMELVHRQGRIMFIPTVPGQNDEKPVVFTLFKLEGGRYIFENKEHDFPSRVVYVLPKENILQAWIEGSVNGQTRRMDFSFKKVE